MPQIPETPLLAELEQIGGMLGEIYTVEEPVEGAPDGFPQLAERLELELEKRVEETTLPLMKELGL